MITNEDIMLARIVTARLIEEDKALLIARLNPEGELKVLLAGDDESTDTLFEALSGTAFRKEEM